MPSSKKVRFTPRSTDHNSDLRVWSAVGWRSRCTEWLILRKKTKQLLTLILGRKNEVRRTENRTINVSMRTRSERKSTQRIEYDDSEVIRIGPAGLVQACALRLPTDTSCVVIQKTRRRGYRGTQLEVTCRLYRDCSCQRLQSEPGVHYLPFCFYRGSALSRVSSEKITQCVLLITCRESS